LVNALIGQFIRQAVFGPGHMRDSIGLEVLQLVFGEAPQGEKVGGLDAILTVELLDQQFGIGEDLELADTKSGGFLQPEKQGLVFRHVVGGFPQVAGQLCGNFPQGISKDGPGPGRPRVAPGGAVAKEAPEPSLTRAVVIGHFPEKHQKLIFGKTEAFPHLGEVKTLRQGPEDRGPVGVFPQAPAQEVTCSVASPSAASSSCQ
jgi:hypothetical protein